MRFALIVNKVTKKFGDFIAVNEVSFDVEEGKFFSILGPSGCGKTTLLRMIAGFSLPTSGSVKISGKDMSGIEPNKRPVNLIFQNLALFPMMNVRENIAFGLKRRGERGKEVYKKVDSMLERIEMTEYGSYKIEQLSGGQKQRVAIARSLVLEPSILLLDEPLGALDRKLRESMMIYLKELQRQVGTTFIYVTHDQSEAMLMSDYVAVMNHGEFEQIDTPFNLYNKPISSFVAQFVGENNKLIGKVHKDISGDFFLVLKNGNKLLIGKDCNFEPGEKVQMFIRPEAIIINPKTRLKNISVLDVVVKSILFDSANTKIWVIIEDLSEELIIRMPQNIQYDYIKIKDKIKIGWEAGSSVCFKEKGEALW